MSDDTKIDLASKFKKVKKEVEEKQSLGERFLEIANDIIDEQPGNLVASDDTLEAVSLYRVSSDNVLTILPEKTLESLVFSSNPHLLAKNTKEIMRLIKLTVFSRSAIDLATVQPVAFADEPTQLTWNRLTLKRSDLGRHQADTPALKAFAHLLSLCDDPNALTLWIGSLLDPRAGRAQYLHLHGGGGNGKSTLFNGIGRVLGERYTVTTRADEFSNQHWGSILEGARVLIFPDENNPGFFSTGKFKEFTGEDSTTVNPKYEKPRRIRLTHKTAVFSNNRVEISSSVADRRRLLSVSMSDDPSGNVGFRWWYDDLKNGGAEILAYCFGEYEKAVAADSAIRAYIPQRTETVNAAIDRKYADVTEVICDTFAVTADPAHSLPRALVHAEIVGKMGERRTNRFFMQQLKEALRHLGVVERGADYVGMRAGKTVDLPLKTPKGV